MRKFALILAVLFLVGCAEEKKPTDDGRTKKILQLENEVYQLKQKLAVEKTPQEELQEKHRQELADQKIENARVIADLDKKLQEAKTNVVLDELLPLQRTLKRQTEELKSLDQAVQALQKGLVEVRKSLDEKANKNHSH